MVSWLAYYVSSHSFKIKQNIYPHNSSCKSKTLTTYCWTFTKPFTYEYFFRLRQTNRVRCIANVRSLTELKNQLEPLHVVYNEFEKVTVNLNIWKDLINAVFWGWSRYWKVSYIDRDIQGRSCDTSFERSLNSHDLGNNSLQFIIVIRMYRVSQHLKYWNIQDQCVSSIPCIRVLSNTYFVQMYPQHSRIVQIWDTGTFLRF